MIVVRFFTGVIVKYPTATFWRKHHDGGIEICSGSIESAQVLTYLQSTAGALIDRGEGVGITMIPAQSKNKSIFEQIFGEKG